MRRGCPLHPGRPAASITPNRETAEMARYPRRMILRAGLASIFAAIRAGANSARAAFASQLPGERVEREAISPEQVRRAIRDGVGFLKSRQQADGSWPNIPNQHQHVAGINGLIAHALLTAGESPASPHLAAALKFLEQFSPEEIDGTYSVALQTMAFAESDPDRYRTRIASNVAWLEGAQIKEGDKGPGWPGTWAHTSDKRRPGDNSSTQFALLGLHAASQAGVAVSPRIWERTRACLERAQCVDGGWPYYPGSPYSPTTASMTCAGISGLIITGSRLFQAKETLVGDAVMDCGKKGVHPGIRRGLEWLATNFAVDRNHGASVHHQWKYYYLYGLERASRLTGQRLFGDRDWYREGTQELLAGQDPVLGSWAGAIHEREPTLATSLAVLFLATARAPVLINKLAHGPGGDWNNDIDDIRNLVDAVSADWKHRLTWQAIDPEAAGIEGLLQAPIAYFNGHEAPEFGPRARKILREYVDQGGFILAEACCGDRHEGFDRGFRALMKELFPEPGYGLRQLPPDHGVWRSGRDLDPGEHPLWGIELGCRTAVIYSPADLSCLWNQMEAHPSHPGVIRAGLIGRNIVDYVTGRQLPADRLAPPRPARFQGRAAPARRPPHRQAEARGRLERGAAGDPEPRRRAAQPSPELRCRRQALRTAPRGSQPGQLPADLHPRQIPDRIHGGPAREPQAACLSGEGHVLRGRCLQQPRLRHLLPRDDRGPVPEQPARPHPRRGRALHHQDRLRPLRLPAQRGDRRGPGSAAA
jgi:hypothetical protein